MPRPPTGRVGRSAGVAEHQDGHRSVIRLTRTTRFTRVSALACVVALAIAGVPGVASAQTSTPSLGRIRAEIDATASQWFAAQRTASALDLKIQTLGRTLAETEHQVGQLRHRADARAVLLYESGTQALEGVMGNDPLEIGRRAALIGQANADGQVAIDEFEAAIADLTARRSELHAARKALTGTLGNISARRHALDTELSALQQRSRRAAAHGLLAPAIARRASETVTTSAPTRPAVIEVATPPATGTPTLAVTSPVAPPETGAVSPHHDEPFLVCTRARESNGDYSVVSRDGYYGAYQFSPTTWNVTATHLGRFDLVGVLPSTASQYDQDEMAWSLYQWQGNSPWGGRC